MSDLKLQSITQVGTSFLAPLMDKEEQAWRSELDWDYAPIRIIIASFLNQKLLPGFVASQGGQACGYTYFLIQRYKGVIGTLFSACRDPQDAAERILSEAIDWLKGSPNIRRIEAQLFPLSQVELTPIFKHHGFRHYVRHYLELDLGVLRWNNMTACADEIIPWEYSYLAQAAQVIFQSYRNELDAVICDDYCSQSGCENYLRSLVENPGCGIFLPEASYIGIDKMGMACGFVISSRISSTAAMIPQISIHPSHQGQHLGTALIRRALDSIHSLGFSTVRLTVTEKNRRAYDWYQRLGFSLCKVFGAYVWQRNQQPAVKVE